MDNGTVLGSLALYLHVLPMEVKWLRGGFHYRVEWAEESLEVLLGGQEKRESTCGGEDTVVQITYAFSLSTG